MARGWFKSCERKMKEKKKVAFVLELQKLHELHLSGGLSADEFAAAKRLVLRM